jgi:hypothetical protein
MHALQFFQRERLTEPMNRSDLVGIIIPVPVFVAFIVFLVPYFIRFQWGIASAASSSWKNLADVMNT